ncbi:metalloregulator ArsR/SmtB family transcription factor [Halocynthiibacter sp. C4]|uniref:ArsR/SmtB family transcription factor n=1 Tax=Halocynthiibacter sp. C4 TaxID=2992758 RepID=UPI00237C24B2|nr:metalloregulator ArsR/SmtB family transcription factor [Halocynthiibacter sp. C4]MDE0588796.1 metalloregulator ArsR/SmtB family transcription factor [Halocynthiibacter sp. C4]
MGTHERHLKVEETKANGQVSFENEIPAISRFLKSISHEGRLQILCHLSSGEKTVGELEALLGVRQAAVSQQLSRLRNDGLVQCRRSGKSIIYRLKRQECSEQLGALHHFLGNDRA